MIMLFKIYIYLTGNQTRTSNPIDGENRTLILLFK